MAVLLALLGAAPAAAQDVAAPVDACVPADPGLAEQSGLATDGSRWFATADGGTSLRVAVLDPVTCAVVEERTAGADPYDVEDLALAADGALWLADTGDNDATRETVALHRLAPDGTTALFRLTYPDGPHDAEALLLDRAGVPHIVTKVISGASAVYRPAGPLAEPGPTPLERVAEVRIELTDTPGGPVGNIGSVLVTGGAVSADGTVVALRTYTDAYLYPAPDGDVVAALAADPVRVPLAGEPQGEAVALAPDGTLLSGSEAVADGPNPPVRTVAGAVALLDPPEEPGPLAGLLPGGDGRDGEGGLTQAQGVILAILVATVLVLGVLRLMRLRRP